MAVDVYLADVQKRFATGKAREHAYRPALQGLIETLLPNVTATNDAAHIEVGAPDFILTRRGIEVGYIECKDLGADLDKVEKDEQLKRYLEGLPNVILTDYLEFRFFLQGEKVAQIRIGEIEDGKIKTLPVKFDRFRNLLLDFASFEGQTIKSAKKLAQMMARKARLMRDVFYRAVSSEKDSTLKDQLAAFRKILVHDMDEAQFADVYAQTIAYGLFTARLHDKTLEDFSRAEAYELVPRSNPFLRQLFHYVAGPDLDDRVIWIVDALCEVFRFTDLKNILKDFGTATGKNDPILHFYETFLAEYDKKLRKARGVFYTPEPVVNFIVRAVDDVLQTHFGLKDGLADNSKIQIEIESHEKDKRSKTGRKKEDLTVHKVQILDVATGTGTFLAEVVKQVYARFEGQQGRWPSYVEEDLLPRLHGFELLMASYAMCHMKLDLLLQETGYQPKNLKKPPRVSVYLTNSLEEHHPDAETFWATWLSREANEASRIKRDIPIMVAIGNPPYSGISQNMGDWIIQKIDDYKYVEGRHFGEKKHWLHDDYVKFIRLGEYYIEKNGEGIFAYITNHGYLDNPTFRGMRWHLLNTFDEIFVLDLHGNSNKKEISPDGTPDKNVFDIQQGVAIIIGIKSGQKKRKDIAKVFHKDLWGSREKKYDFLEQRSLKNTPWETLETRSPFFHFIPQNFKAFEEYQGGFPLNKIFRSYVTGIVTSRDKFVIDFNEGHLRERIRDFCDKNLETKDFQAKYSLSENYQWKCKEQRKLTPPFSEENFKNINYRPFDRRRIYFQENLVFRMRNQIMRNFFLGKNLGLVFMRHYAYEAPYYSYVLVTDSIIDNRYFISNKGIANIAPLYTYDTVNGDVENKNPNLDPKIYDEIKKIVPKVTPESLFDYIYAVLHSPVYRERYAEFLKSDFPRIPYPKDAKTFDAMARLGGELRALHLMESPGLDRLITTYPVGGDHKVDKVRFEKGKVRINPTQYFGGVPEAAWGFYIGGYQPAQKWLKDRKGRALSADDIKHYQRIIVALTETGKIMEKIAKIDFLPGDRNPK